MRKITALWGVLWMIIPVAFAQNIVTVSFTGNLSNGNWHPLDSVVVCDSLNGWSKTLVYDDTTLILHTANDINEEVFSTHSNIRCFPNPFVKQTSVEFYSASGTVQMLLFDMVGNQIAQWNGSVAAGIQSFSISTKRAQPYLLKIFTKDKVLSTKLICAQGGGADEIDFVENKLKFIPQIKLDCTEPFTLGDEMTYTGYSVQGTMPQSVTICHQQWNDELIPFVFPMVTPKYCPEHSTLQDVDGNSYSTVLIGKQCWMRENLKTAHYADGVALPIGNDTVHDHSIPFYF
ncbi:MAG: T9SS type A sorting domain-containing protein, partial [Bacteroidales bacterium]|nr:T9SS type A sorting domain-containing protein [Bacteroidales bacterium]